MSHGCLGWGVADTLREMFPECHLTHRHRIESLLGESWMSGVGVADTLREMFPDCHLTHRHRIESLLGESWMSGVGGG